MRLFHTLVIGAALYLGLSGIAAVPSAPGPDAVREPEESIAAADTLQDYRTVESLLDDADVLVKVEVLGTTSGYVRSYIYTSYDCKVLDTVYGAVLADGDRICINMPGGTISADQVKTMLSEVTAGKNAGDLPGIGQITSDGNTDRLLSVGDMAYLFLKRESETAFAAVGAYRGEILLEDGALFFDSGIDGWEAGVCVPAMHDGSMTERELIEMIQNLTA